MDSTRIESQESGVDREVGALLGHVRQSASIIDDLLALPLPEADAPPEWNEAVARRLERKLADAMRAILQPQSNLKPEKDERRSA